MILRVLPILLLTARLADPVQASEVYTAPFGPDGTWNLYQVDANRTATWDQARRLAAATPPPVGTSDTMGHLAVLGSVAEAQFIRLINDRQWVWIGLTDNERFGGSESNGHALRGWKWLTGEPLEYSRWLNLRPDDWRAKGDGEDGVFAGGFGRWDDSGTGVSGEQGRYLRFAIEWETRSKTPVEGAIPLTKVWPDELGMPECVPGEWNVRWVNGYVMATEDSYQAPQTISDAARLLNGTQEGVIVSSEGTDTTRLPWLSIATADENRETWFADTSKSLENLPGLPQAEQYVAAAVGKVHVASAGTYSFCVGAEEAFALRVGGKPWQSASGDGFIDPLDPSTLTLPYGGRSNSTVGVIDLPAGDHLVEALWMVETRGSEFHVFSAPGSHRTEGSTDAWRPLGRPAQKAKLPRLGVTEEGWSVACSAGIGKPIESLQEGLLRLELDLDRASRQGVASVNFANEPAALGSRFPDAALFPNDRGAEANNHWPFRASARLVVPGRGIYHVGLYAEGRAVLRIKRGVLMGFPQMAQPGRALTVREDSFEFDGQADPEYMPKVVSQWSLDEGEYDIDVFYLKAEGPATLAVFSNPAGPFAPQLLQAGGAALVADVPSLLLAR